MSVAFVVAAWAAAGGAQSAAPPATSLDETCELHVWPGSKLGSVYSGWFHGGIVNGAVTGRDGYPVAPADAIETKEQAALLKAAQPQKLLGLQGYRLVIHDTALPSSVIRRTPGRVGTSAAPCYAELIVDDVMLQHDGFVTGKFLKTLFRYREFDSGPTPTRSFGTWVQTRLTKFPPATAADEAAAREEVRTAFSNNVAVFASALRNPRKKR